MLQLLRRRLDDMLQPHPTRNHVILTMIFLCMWTVVFLWLGMRSFLKRISSQQISEHDYRRTTVYNWNNDHYVCSHFSKRSFSQISSVDDMWQLTYSVSIHCWTGVCGIYFSVPCLPLLSVSVHDCMDFSEIRCELLCCLWELWLCIQPLTLWLVSLRKSP